MKVLPGVQYVTTEDGEVIDLYDCKDGFVMSMWSPQTGEERNCFNSTFARLRLWQALLTEWGWEVKYDIRPATVCKGDRGGLYERINERSLACLN